MLLPVTLLLCLVSSTLGASLFGRPLPQGTCVCATADAAAYFQPAFNADRMTYLRVGECMRTTGQPVQQSVTWYGVIYMSQTVWVAGEYLELPDKDAISCD